MENLVNTAVSEYGRLEVMVNNAGIFTGLHTIVDENRRRPHHARQLQERMAGQQVRDPADASQDSVDGSRGRVVNIASIGGLVGSRPSQAIAPPRAPW
jgi:NAD(P)-dependent dehydrogenase (short-subunit alcohol dehydrogenase family)